MTQFLISWDRDVKISTLSGVELNHVTSARMWQKKCTSTCDTSSVTCGHMWQFYTVLYWRDYLTVDNLLSFPECSTPSDGSWAGAALTSGWPEEGERGQEGARCLTFLDVSKSDFRLRMGGGERTISDKHWKSYFGLKWNCDNNSFFESRPGRRLPAFFTQTALEKWDFTIAVIFFVVTIVFFINFFLIISSSSS